MKDMEYDIDAAHDINTEKIVEIMTSERQTGKIVEMINIEKIRCNEISKRFKRETGMSYETYLMIKDIAERINRDVNIEFCENDKKGINPEVLRQTAQNVNMHTNTKRFA